MEAIPASRERSGLSYSGLVTEVVAVWEDVQSKTNKQHREGAALHRAKMKRPAGSSSGIWYPEGG